MSLYRFYLVSAGSVVEHHWLTALITATSVTQKKINSSWVDANVICVEQACFLCQVYVPAALLYIQPIIKQITLLNYESWIGIHKPECLLFAIIRDSHGLKNR